MLNASRPAALETAAWDLEAHRRNTGIAALLGERLGLAPAASISCGVAFGIPADRSLDTLRRWIDEALPHGYRRVKIKIVGPSRRSMATRQPSVTSLASAGLNTTRFGIARKAGRCSIG